MQKKSLLIIAMLGLISVSFLIASPTVVAESDQWAPEDKIPGYKRIAGQEINLSGNITIIEVDYIQVDVWGKGSDPSAPEAIVISIAIKNTTNIFDAATSSGNTNCN